jgi:cysteinyl-tRNA synthetase
MARERLGEVIDIHSGGEDLIFPHHECEIAQSRCATGREAFARYWVHTRFLRVEGEKMSKSAGNFFTARQIMERGFGADALRLALVGTHYRQNANFTERGLKDAAGVVARWRRFVGAGESSGEAGAPNIGVARAFAEAMNDDLNIAGALAAVNRWVKETGAPTRADAALMRVFDGVVGVLGLSPAGAVAGGGGDGVGEGAGGGDREIDELVAARERARRERDFAEADRLRDELDERGVEVTDTPDGPVWAWRAAL